MPLSDDDVSWARAGAGLLPQPIAYAMGRIVRSPTDIECLDWSVRAAEVVARYTAMAACASFSARDQLEVQPKLPDVEWGRGVSLGTFVELASVHARSEVPHLLQGCLTKPFVGRARQQGPAAAASSFAEVVQFRNKNAHGLRGMSELKARSLLPDMLGHLRTIVDSLKALLRLPVIVFDEQWALAGRTVVRMVPVMGEAEPFPIQVALDHAAHLTKVPYLVIGGRLLMLAPGMVWQPVGTSFECKLFLLDATSPDRYRTVFADEPVAELEDPNLALEWLAGGHRPVEDVRAEDGRSLGEVWAGEVASETREIRKEAEAIVSKAPAKVKPTRPVVPAAVAEIGVLDAPFAREVAAAGFGEVFSVLVLGIAERGFVFRADKRGVKVESPKDRRFYVLYVELAKRPPGLKITVGDRAITSLYGRSIEQIELVVPGRRRIVDSLEQADALLRDLDRLISEGVGDGVAAVNLTAAPGPVRLCVERMEAWALGHGLHRRNLGSTVQFATPGNRPVADISLDGDPSVNLNVEWAARNGHPLEASELLTTLRNEFHATPGRRYQRIPCAEVASRWDDFLTQILEPLAQLHGLDA